MDQPDRTLIERLQAGDPLALDEFYRAHAKQVLGWAIRLGGPKLDAEDIAQDVFAVALRRIHTFRGESRVSTWLFSITRNVIANARRRAAIRRFVGLSTIEEIGRSPELDEKLDRARQRQLVQRALERLNTQQREVLVLMDLEERSAPEVSKMLGVPTGTVYSRLHYARKAFAKSLQREGTGQELAAIGATAPGSQG